MEEFKVGDIVILSEDAVYYTGQPVAPWVRKFGWTISSISGSRAILGKSADGHYSLNIPINTKYLNKFE